MSRIDPSILGRIRPLPTPLEMEQQNAAIENQRALAEERQMQAAQLRAKFQQDREKYNSEAAIKALLQNKPDATAQEVLAVGGSAGLPFASEYFKAKQLETDQKKQQLDNHTRMIDEIGRIANGLLNIPPEQRPQFKEREVQRAVQDGVFDTNAANEFLSSHDTDEDLTNILKMTPQWKTRLAEMQNEAKAASDKAAADALTLQREASAKSSEATARKTEMEMAGTLPLKPQQQTAPRTVTTDQGIMQWNPETQKYDIKVGNKPANEQVRPITQTAEANLVGRLSRQWESDAKAATLLNNQLQIMDAGMNAARRGDLAQGAQAVLVTFQKILDPISVVRESEYMRSAAGLALMDRAKGALERMAKGGAGVPLSELEKFSQLAKDMAKGQTQHLKVVKERIGKTADRYQIPRELVIDEDLTGEAPSAPAAASDMIDVQIPGQPPGKIHSSQWQAFLKKYPNAKKLSK